MGDGLDGQGRYSEVIYLSTHVNMKEEVNVHKIWHDRPMLVSRVTHRYFPNNTQWLHRIIDARIRKESYKGKIILIYYEKNRTAWVNLDLFNFKAEFKLAAKFLTLLII